MTRTEFRRTVPAINWPRRIAEHLAAVEPGNPADDLVLIDRLAMGGELIDFADIQRARVLLRGARNDWDMVTPDGQTALIKALEARAQ